MKGFYFTFLDIGASARAAQGMRINFDWNLK